MADKSVKEKTQRHRKVTASVIYVLCCIYVIVFVFGCGESSQTFGDDYITDRSSLQAQAYQIIQNALDDTNPVARVNAIEVVATTGQYKLMPKVQRLLHDEFPPVRFAAALAVGDMRFAPAKSTLNPLLTDKDVNVIVAASYAMGRLGSTEYYEVLRRALNNIDQTVRANAAFLLGKTGDKSSLDILKSAQEDKSSNDKVRFQILEARARLGDVEVLQKLWAIVYSAFADDRIMGIRAIGTLGTPKARDILVTKLDDPVLEVRIVAAEQLGKLQDRIGESEVLDVFDKNLIAGLDTEAVERVYVLTALAIGEICTPDLEKFLPRLLKNESLFVRIAAAKAVFRCKTD